MGQCSSAPRLKANLRSFIAANPNEGYGDGWYFDTMNVLLDRWAYSHVQFLRKKFLEATGDKGEKELDKKGFFKLFAELQDMPKAVAESAFRMFDTDNSGKLNFREFCCALALCCHLMSSDDEKIRFVFDMFDTNDDGLLSSADVQLLLEHALPKESTKEADEQETSKRQQRIAEIKQELLGNAQHLTYERFYEWATRNLGSLNNLLHTFQIVPAPERERAICEEILSRHQTLQEGSTWYCISHKWLQVWKAHASWQGPAPGRRVPAPSVGGQGLLSVSREATQDDEIVSEEPVIQAVTEMGSVGPLQHMSTRPPEIDNSDLEGEHKGELKMNLVEHLDYELIPEEMWLKLVEWYGGGPAILRKVICMGEDSQPQVELYPPLLLVVVAGENGQPLPQFSRRFFISRQSSLDEVLLMLGEKLSRPADRSRLWHRAKGEEWRPVQLSPNVALEEFLEGKVWDAGAFMLETQKPSGEWPRESDATGKEPDVVREDGELQRSFEVGDRVEAQSGVTGQWMRGTIVDKIQRDHTSAPSQVKVHYDSTVYKYDEWISTTSDRLAPLDTHTSANSTGAGSSPPPMRGATGLQNLGNTCFLNATIQCMANTPLLREYFLSTQYVRDITGTNGCQGRLAEEFGHLMGDLWSGKDSALTPRNLKRTIDQFAPQFAGYEQHDAQELLAFFLDGLHEDLNRGAIAVASNAGAGKHNPQKVGTPKLFISAKNTRAGSLGRSGSRDMSPKRQAKAAWRDRSNEHTPTPPPSMTQPSKDAVGSPKRPSCRLGAACAQRTSPAHAAALAHPGDADYEALDTLSSSELSKPSDTSQSPMPTSSVVSPSAGTDAGVLAASAIPREQDNLLQGGNDLPEDAALSDLSVQPNEANRTLDRLVHPTVLWQPTGPRPRIGPDDEATPGWPTVQSMMPGAKLSTGDVADRVTTDRVPRQPQASVNPQPPPGRALEVTSASTPSSGPSGGGTAAVPDLGAADAAKDKIDGVAISAAAAAPATAVSPVTATPLAPVSAPATTPASEMRSEMRALKREAETAASRREAEAKRPGTSRWWSFAWRRGRGALDLPKDSNSCDGPHVMSDPATAAGVAANHASATTTEAAQSEHGPPRSFSPGMLLVNGAPQEAEGNSSAGVATELPAAAAAAGGATASKDTMALIEELRPKLPAGAASAAVAAAAANRVSEEAPDAATFNETEDFVPELLTPQRPTYKRSLSLFSLSWRRGGASAGAVRDIGSPKRRPRTPPTMSPLREERLLPGESAGGSSGSDHAVATRNNSSAAAVAEAPPLGTELTVTTDESGASPDGTQHDSPVVTREAGATVSVPPGTASRSFLPWRGKRPSSTESAGPRRDGSREPEEEAGDATRGTDTNKGAGRGAGTASGGNATSQTLPRADSREGRSRTKDKESWWPSLRRSKSRDGGARWSKSSADKLQVASGSRPPPAPHKGDLPIVDCMSAETDAPGSVPDGEANVYATAGSNADDWGGKGIPREPHVGAPQGSGGGFGFPFLRAPWKRAPAEQPRGGSPTKTQARSAAATPVETTSPPAQQRSSSAGSSCGETSAEHTAKELEPNKERRPNEEGRPQDAEGEQSDGEPCEVSEENTTEDADANEDNLPDEEKALRQWERYRAQNRSLIVDVFEGQLRSQLTCCHCGASSSTFEPFRYLSVPIPSNHVDRATLRVVFFPLPLARGDDRPQLERYSVIVPKSATVQKVEKALSRLLPVAMNSVLMAEVYRSRIHRYLDSGLSLSDVRAEDQLFAFEVLQSPNELMEYQERYAPSRRKEKPEDENAEQKKVSQPRVLLIQAMHRRVVDVCRSDGRTWAQRREVFGLPFVMSAASSWTYATLHDMLMLHARRFLKTSRSHLGLGASGAAVVGSSASSVVTPEGGVAQMPFVARIVNASGTACGACDRRNCTGCLLPKGNAKLRLRAGLLTGAVNTAKIYLALDWVDSVVYDQEYVDSVKDDPSVARAAEADGDHPDRDDWDEQKSQASHEGTSYAVERNVSKASGPTGVPISACIDAFAQPEELKKEFGNGIKCEKCGEVVDAVKRLEIWREPDVLLLHIKRFHFSGLHYEKLNTPVEVPFKELNLRPWIVGPSGSSAAPYELYAVACHFGGMSGGHYTSFAANTDGKDTVWLKYNDEAVTTVALGHELDEISRQCYVLFYRKRAFSSSNLINYSAIM